MGEGVLRRAVASGRSCLRAAVPLLLVALAAPGASVAQESGFTGGLHVGFDAFSDAFLLEGGPLVEATSGWRFAAGWRIEGGVALLFPAVDEALVQRRAAPGANSAARPGGVNASRNRSRDGFLAEHETWQLFVRPAYVFSSAEATVRPFVGLRLGYRSNGGGGGDPAGESRGLGAAAEGGLAVGLTEDLDLSFTGVAGYVTHRDPPSARERDNSGLRLGLRTGVRISP